MGIRISRLPKLSAGEYAFNPAGIPLLQGNELTALVQGLTTFQCPASGLGGVIYDPSYQALYIRQYDYPFGNQKLPPGVGSVDLMYKGSSPFHSVTGNYSGFLAGGYNSIDSDYSVVIGGSGNSIVGGHNYSFIAGRDITSVAEDTLHVNNLYATQNATIMGNLSVFGNATYIETTITSTSALSVVNAGSGPALFIKQTGTEPVAIFADAEGGQMVIADTGKVGIGTDNPLEKLSIIGNLSGVGNITYDGLVKLGNNQTISAGTNNSILGGNSNTITTGSNSVIVAGAGNSSLDNYSFIGGGQSNSTGSSYVVIGGGYSNNASGQYNVIGGGDTNTTSLDYATVGGGVLNVASGYSSTVAGGAGNESRPDGSTIGGGASNIIYSTAPNGTIGGGSSNELSGYNATIAGGYVNGAHGYMSFVGSGSANWVWSAADHGVIVGGSNNTAHGKYTMIGGGYNLSAIGDYSSAVGGLSNTAFSTYSFIGGGSANSVTAGAGQAIVGGYNNIITASVGQSVIVGGLGNTLGSSWSVIVGGRANTSNSTYGFIGGGLSNVASLQSYNTIVGGYSSRNYGFASFVGAGSANGIFGDFSSIVGGRKNLIPAGGNHSFIAGSSGNTTAFENTFILGKDITAPLPDRTYVNSLSASNSVTARLSACTYIANFGTLNAGTYQLASSDVSKTLIDTFSTTATIQIPPNSVVAFETGTQITVIQGNKSATNYTILSAGDGVTINSFSASLTAGGNFAAITLLKTNTNEWYAIGNLK